MYYSHLMIGVGAATFLLVNTVTDRLVPVSICHTPQHKWKWRNVATSLLHSLVTAVWSLVAFYQAPHVWEDLIVTYTDSTYTLVCFSIGYFIYDSMDMLVYHRKRSTYELLVHHLLVMLCFIIAVTIKQYVAYVALSLLVEINSIFLHTRQLFIVTNEPKISFRYKVNSLLNIATFLLFRILLLGWMTRWLATYRDKIPMAIFTVSSISLAIIVVMNIVLFLRILSVDFLGALTKQLNTREITSCNSREDDIKQGYMETLLEEENVEEDKYKCN